MARGHPLSLFSGRLTEKTTIGAAIDPFRLRFGDIQKPLIRLFGGYADVECSHGIGNRRSQPYVGFMDSDLTAGFIQADFGETIEDQTRFRD
jgi:hypothetical protein